MLSYEAEVWSIDLVEESLEPRPKSTFLKQRLERTERSKSIQPKSHLRVGTSEQDHARSFLLDVSMMHAIFEASKSRCILLTQLRFREM